MLNQLVEIRILALSLGFGILIVFFVFLAYKILRHYRNRINFIFSFWYITAAVGLSINIIYIYIADLTMIRILNKTTTYLVAFSAIFLTVFCISFFKGEREFNTKKQISLILVYGILLSFLFFISDGIELSPETNMIPVWSWFLFIYITLIIVFMSWIPTLYFSLKQYFKFEDEQLKKKWVFFIIGTVELYSQVIGTFLINTLNIPSIRILWYVILFFTSLSGAYFTYYGIAGKV